MTGGTTINLSGVALLAVLGGGLLLATFSSASMCTGDCDENSAVTVDELVKGVSIALGQSTVDECPSFDCLMNGHVTVACLVKAVNDALSGCVATTPTPAPTLVSTTEPTATATAVPTSGTPSIENLEDVLCTVPIGEGGVCSSPFVGTTFQVDDTPSVLAWYQIHNGPVSVTFAFEVINPAGVAVYSPPPYVHLAGPGDSRAPAWADNVQLYEPGTFRVKFTAQLPGGPVLVRTVNLPVRGAATPPPPSPTETTGPTVPQTAAPSPIATPTQAALGETCNGLDDDHNGLVDDTLDARCWRTIYRFKNSAEPLAARCLGPGTAPPATCSHYAFDAEAFVVATNPVPGTYHAVQCSKLNDHIVVELESDAYNSLSAAGYECTKVDLGYIYTLGAAPPSGTTQWAHTCALWRFTNTELGIHLFTRGADNLNDLQCELPARGQVFSNFACFPDEGPVECQQCGILASAEHLAQTTIDNATGGSCPSFCPQPPQPSTTRYITTTAAADLDRMGCAQGSNAEAGVIVLDVGGGTTVGTSFGASFRSAPDQTTAQIGSLVQNWINGYLRCSSGSSRVTVAIGTNNSIAVNSAMTALKARAHGEAWANMVKSVQNYVESIGASSQIAVAGGIDAETLYNSATVTILWAEGFNAGAFGTANLYNYGDAGGCRQSATTSIPGTCSGQWTQDDVYMLSWGIGTAYPLPEIYSSSGANARQWQQIALYGILRYSMKMFFSGSLTTLGACIYNHDACVGINNSPARGWYQLWRELNCDSRTAQDLPASSDITWAN